MDEKDKEVMKKIKMIDKFKRNRIYTMVHDVSIEWFLKKLNQMVKEGWEPIHTTFRVDNEKGYNILLVKGGKV